MVPVAGRAGALAHIEGRRQSGSRVPEREGARLLGMEALDYVWEMTREEWNGRRALASTE